MKSSLLLLFSCVLCLSLSAQDLQQRNVVTGLDTPWEMVWGEDGWIWFTERGGTISRVNPVDGTLDRVAKISDVYEVSESGLLGMVLHPDFENNPYVYIAYTYNSGGHREKLVRLRYENDTLSNPAVFLDNIPAASNHSGARLLVGPDDLIYMSTGDASVTANSQDSSSYGGKILRFTLDGQVPAGNPIPSSYIFATGLRNTQGLTWAHGHLYGSEHGPNNDDEVNRLTASNYGWPEVHGFCNTPTENVYCQAWNVVEPLKAWTPTIAPAGIEYYNHSGMPGWQNSLLMVTLKDQDLRVLKLNDDGTAITDEDIFLDGQLGRLRDVLVSPDGRIFISTSNKDGRGSPQAQDDRIIELSSVSGIGPSQKVGRLLNLYPSPAQDIVYLKNLPRNSQITVTDVWGRVVLAEKWQSTFGQLDVSTLTAGYYFVQVFSAEGVSTGRFVKQ